MIGIPYICTARMGQGPLLCASKGPSIHTYSLGLEGTSQLLSSWTHPSSRKQDEKGDDAPTAPRDNAAADEQPPPKRRRLGSSTDSVDVQLETSEAASTQRDRKMRQKGKNNTPTQIEWPFVILLEVTDNGRHVVAVTAQDKAVWLFEHDGKGVLKQLSQRVMPKRPSSISITADGQTILVGDKFGDVYALPLIPRPIASDASTSGPSTPVPPTQTKRERGANAFTVHSKSNLRAMEEQRKQEGKRKDVRKEGPIFEHQLLLGHVSMLTSLIEVTLDGKTYIVTGDRDEHIRVSRGIPQAHVIETYCLGHESFVNALCVPESQPEFLVSGGGDKDLFLWNWRKGLFLEKADLLDHIRELVPDAQNVAVSRIGSYTTDHGCYVIAICERVPGLLVYGLQSQTKALKHLQTLKTFGNVLDFIILKPGQDRSLHLVVATDPASGAGDIDTCDTVAEDSSSLVLYDLDSNNQTAWTFKGGITPDANREVEVDYSTVDSNTLHHFPREELEKILYPVGNLRKTGNEGGGGEEIEGGDDSEGQQQATISSYEGVDTPPPPV